MKYLPYRHNFLGSVQEIKNLLVLVAMKSEEDALVEDIAFREVFYGNKLKVSTKRFRLSQCDVAVALSGVGLVNAALALSSVVENNPVDAVVLMGVGGALEQRLNPGDVVVSNQIIQHDSISSFEKRSTLIAPGELTLSAPADRQVDPVMRCDEILVNWISTTFHAMHQNRIFCGTILSGSEFVADTSKKRMLRSLAEDALLVDMESGAVAQLSRKLQIPFVAVKTVADRANPAVSIADDYKQTLESAAAQSARVFKKMLKVFD